MRINYAFLAIVLIAAVVFRSVTADSKEGVGDSKNGALSVGGSDDNVNGAADPTKKGDAVNLENNDSREQHDLKEKEIEVNNRRDERKENKDSSSESNKTPKKGRLPPVREKCDSSSNHCTDDDKTLVACLIFPGNDSPAPSLIILNKGKGSQSITISAPDSVQLERKQIELQENKDTEVSIRNVANGDFIVLTAGPRHGNCTLDLKDQVMGTNTDNHSPTSTNFSNYKLSLSWGIVFLGGLVIAGVSVFLWRKSGRQYFARKGLKYQRMDMELPVSHGNTSEGVGNEGWDNSWGDNWDEEEASATPSLPLTPTLSSRKFKEGWKD